MMIQEGRRKIADLQTKLGKPNAELQAKLADCDAEVQALTAVGRPKPSGWLRIIDKVRSALHELRKDPRRSLGDTLVRYCRRPHRKARLLRLVRLLPPLERKLLRFLEIRSESIFATTPVVWAIDPDPAILADWKKITSFSSKSGQGED